jgi:hypothetical protein
MSQVEDARQAKKKTRGGFNNHIFLESTNE